jgi:hypothetical protein
MALTCTAQTRQRDYHREAGHRALNSGTNLSSRPAQYESYFDATPPVTATGALCLMDTSSTPVPSVTATDGPTHQGELGTPREPVRCSAMCLLVNTSAFGAVWMAW